MTPVRKIINDPVYGFITIDHPLILQIISHPCYQRLRNIHQMAFAHLGVSRRCSFKIASFSGRLSSDV